MEGPNKPLMFVPGKAFQPSPLFKRKTWSLPKWSNLIKLLNLSLVEGPNKPLMFVPGKVYSPFSVKQRCVFNECISNNDNSS